MYCSNYFIHLLIILGMRANLVLTVTAPTFPEPCSWLYFPGHCPELRLPGFDFFLQSAWKFFSYSYPEHVGMFIKVLQGGIESWIWRAWQIQNLQGKLIGLYFLGTGVVCVSGQHAGRISSCSREWACVIVRSLTDCISPTHIMEDNSPVGEFKCQIHHHYHHHTTTNNKTPSWKHPE